MAALSKQRGVELMRWSRDGVEMAYFSGGRILRKEPRGGWKLYKTWRVSELAAVRLALIEAGWTKVRSMGRKVEVQPVD